MDPQRIVVILDKRETFTPESIVFKTFFLLNKEHSLPEDLVLMNERFLRFLADNNIAFEGPLQATLDYNGFSYTYPSYQITLTHPAYLLVERYRDNHPELAGLVVSSIFSKDDQDSFLQNLSRIAQQKAEEKATAQGLVLTGDFEVEEINVSNKGWMVYPPLSARLNHFRQPLGVQYKFYFFADQL